ncbi:MULTISPECIES: hypothetical protein [Rhodovulum]|uniref:Uncharacterized protein n=2 Tax=Rhodovulum TaxID=34008 RepID=A0A8E3AQK8_9RHOB|nr:MULTISPECIES: hypothetical protein [Rhodovulum]PTW49789.1 hypothetical protein C8N38_10650 [Rhodovulum kholense]RAP41336.1 hypothetical protein BYZ73_10325 [Rhodovulum viride]
MTPPAVLDARIWQAIVAGAFVAIGWIVNGWQNRRVAAALRAERTRDVHRALYAEIASCLANLESPEALAAYRDAMAARMREDAGFVPLIPRERNDTVFRALVAEIHILPRVTIDPVVSYYSQLFAIEAMIADMRGERFRALEPERRIAMYEDYIALKVQAFHDGHFALRMIEAFARDGRKGAMDEEARITREIAAGIDTAGAAARAASRISNPGAARSGRSPE